MFVCILMLRLAIIIQYIILIEDVRIIIKTALQLATPFLSILFAFYLLTFEF